jgi:cytochrome c oxidase assembly factor CtaG
MTPTSAAIPPAPTLRDVVLSWQWSPAAAVGLLLLAGGYLALCRAVARDHPRNPWPAVRTYSFLTGLAVVAAATQSAAEVYDGTLLSAHMVQHVLLIMVAPPLLVYGRPVTLALHGAGNPLHARLIRMLRSKAARAVTWPPVTTALYVAVVAGTHTPPVMDLILRSQAAHAGEHALYLLAGYLYFLPVVGSEPAGWRLSFAGRYLVLLAGMQADAIVGLALTLPGHEIFPGYAGTGRTWAPSVLTDQRAGGVLMWAGSDLVMAGLAIVLAVALVHARKPATAADGARLAAYNAFLAALEPGPRPGA